MEAWAAGRFLGRRRRPPWPAARAAFLVLVAVFLAGLPAPVRAARPPAARPNILFIMSDDHAYHAISAYQGRYNQTPHLDRLAREGIRFDGCFVVNSICTPSRATILTGLYSHLNGCPVFNRFDGSQPTVAKEFQAGGYYTGMVGKWHLGSDPTGFDHWIILPGQGVYNDPTFITPRGRKVIKGYVTDLITDLGIEFLEKRPRDKPFFLMLHHKAPHREWTPDPANRAKFASRVIPEADTLWDDYATRTDALRENQQTIARDLTRRDLKLEPPAGLKPGPELQAWYGVKPMEVEVPGEGGPKKLTGPALVKWKYQRYMQDYLACVQGIDDNVGRLLDYLDRAGLRENTVVFYTSDNGFFLGDHGLYDKRFMYEESLRIPLLVRWPGVTPPGSVSDALVLNLDFPETFLEIAGLKVPRRMQGRSLAPLLRGQSPWDWRSAFYYRYYHDPGDHNTRAHYGLRTETHKLIYYWKKDQWEMYDLVRDPQELHNLYDDPASAATVADLKNRLARLKKQVRDRDQFSTNLPPPGVDGQPTNAASATRVLAEWTFDAPGQFEGWRPNGHIQDARVADGVLSCATTGDDPILELVPLLDLPASPWQVIEVRLLADHDGTAEFFWSNTTQTRYGGFSGDKVTSFRVAGDRQWHTYRIHPCWHPEGKIIRFRFDLYGGAKFKVDWLRITEPAAAQAPAEARFDFGREAAGWRAAGQADVSATGRGLQIITGQPGGMAFSPPVKVEAESRNYVGVRMTAERGQFARLFFVTAKQPGLHGLNFPITADGTEHLYNVDMLAASEWKGEVIALGLQPTDAPGARAWVRSLAVSAGPEGPPQLKVASFAPGAVLPRAGLPFPVTALVANLGGTPATLRPPKLETSPGLKILQGPTKADLASPLGFGDDQALRWLVVGAAPGSNRLVFRLEASNTTPVSAGTSVSLTPRPVLPRTGYVPEPRPVRGPFEVGVYYFPGWNTASRWQPIRRFPERTPALGWYREGNPEVADWHIKWAVEHGVTFFAYDWYWSKGARQLEHALHDGYFQARYHHLLKFCLLWANHNPPKTHSLDDCLQVTRFWITNYFNRPEYLRIAGEPLVIIFSTHNLTSDLGSAGVKEAFEAMRAECRRAGLPGLRLAACVAGASSAAQEGYDSITAYNWPGLGADPADKRAPFATLVPAYRRLWEQLSDISPLPLLTPLCGGWDSRPWHGEAALVRFGRTPALFKEHLREARRFLESGRTNLHPAILIEAWNEWGEGSYIEPHQEFGFGYLDAIRDVFADAPGDHLDVTPADAGLGPYDLPEEIPPVPDWTFERGPNGWDSTMQMEGLEAGNGVLSSLTTGDDPAFFGPPFQASAARYHALVLRLRLTHEKGGPFQDTAQLFWRTRRLPESEASSRSFAVAVDGQWHDYQVRLADSPRWAGTVTRLRLDPCTHPGVRVEIERIKLQ